MTETVICRSLLPKANGGGDRGVHVHNQRAMQSIFCTVHGDTSFSTFRLARGQAGTFGLIFSACPRESKSSEITVISVTLSPRSGYFRIKTQRLTVQKSVTYEEKVRDLRCVIHWLTNRITSIKPFNIKQARHLEVISSKS